TAIMVTNTTMLEYMLIRRKDAPIIEKSQGMLKYIVLDEAHSYIGSQAAELALLLRRVMQAFNVGPGTDKPVQIIATSATIGEDSP
ncbi:DEAD/DEAH box helicase, partial [Escherichia coli]|uniref:DEAD/DEAH box helicase n=1 Tax=Escherichia coli TaxID=562 RepID=UPI00117BAAB7